MFRPPIVVIFREVFLKFCICTWNHFDVLCNISFKEDLPEDGHNGWPKHEADYAFCNIRNLNVCIRTYGRISPTESSVHRHESFKIFNTFRHHHHVHEGLGVFPVPWSSKWNWSLHLFLRRPMFLSSFGLYCNICFGILFVSILCTCCSYFSWYCFISFTVFCAPVFPLIHWFFSLSSFVIPNKGLNNFICAASKRCSSLFFSTQDSLANFNCQHICMLQLT